MSSESIFNLEPIEVHISDLERRPTVPYRLYTHSCILCQCDGLVGAHWVFSEYRMVFGQEDCFHASTTSVYNYRTLFSESPHGTSDLFISVHYDQDANVEYDGRQAFIMHEDCFQYLQTLLHLRRCQYGRLIYEMLWILGLSTSPRWSKNDSADENRAQLSVVDSMLDRSSLKLQSSIAALRDRDLALTLTKISRLTDELILKISSHLPLSESTSHHGQHARLAIVFSQTSFILNYIYQQCSFPVSKMSFCKSPVEIDFSASGSIYYSTLRFGGRDYFTRLGTTPFPGSRCLEKDETCTHVVLSVDKVGITGIKLADTGEYLLKRKTPQYDGLDRWYRIAGPFKYTYNIEQKVGPEFVTITRAL